VTFRDPQTGVVHMDYTKGIPVGYYSSDGEFFLFNHWNLLVKTQTVPGSIYNHRIVGF